MHAARCGDSPAPAGTLFEAEIISSRRDCRHRAQRHPRPDGRGVTSIQISAKHDQGPPDVLPTRQRM